MRYTISLYRNLTHWMIGLLLVSTGQTCDQPRIKPDPFGTQETYQNIKIQRSQPKDTTPPISTSASDIHAKEKEKRLELENTKTIILANLKEIKQIDNLLDITKKYAEIGGIIIQDEKEGIVEGIVGEIIEKIARLPIMNSGLEIVQKTIEKQYEKIINQYRKMLASPSQKDLQDIVIQCKELLTGIHTIWTEQLLIIENFISQYRI